MFKMHNADREKEWEARAAAQKEQELKDKLEGNNTTPFVIDKRAAITTDQAYGYGDRSASGGCASTDGEPWYTCRLCRTVLFTASQCLEVSHQRDIGS
jgi:hypothetical protein